MTDYSHNNILLPTKPRYFKQTWGHTLMAKLPPLAINNVQYGLVKRFKALPDAENYYRQHLSKLSRPNAEGWANALCPIHGDRNNSLMVNLRIGFLSVWRVVRVVQT